MNYTKIRKEIVANEKDKKKVLERSKFLIEAKEALDIKRITGTIICTKRQGVYGYQWKSEIVLRYADTTPIFLKSGYTTGWGYDKVSTAVNEALSKHISFHKLVVDCVEKTGRENMPYGIFWHKGDIPKPHFDGCGLSTIYVFLETMKFKKEYIIDNTDKGLISFEFYRK